MAVEIRRQAAAGLPYERTTWYAHWHLAKRRDGEDAPYEVLVGEGNLLVNAGSTALWQALRGDAVTAFSSANSRLGVGDSTTAAGTSQTDLQAATNKLRKAMDSGWPKVGVADGLSANQIQFQATFGSSEANFAWNEWAVFNAAAAGTMLNRAVPGGGLGTKTTGSWTLTVTLSLS